jgi:small neutral amino acid transporter SnatA (MarC family)
MNFPVIFKSAMLMFILLNPFLMIVYLLEIVQHMSFRRFAAIITRAAMISLAVFIVFAVTGDAVFKYVLQARFASLQIFGGIIFLIIGIRFVFAGSDAIVSLRGEPEHISGAIAMPIMIGPGSISASIVAGNRAGTAGALVAVISAVALCVLLLLALKKMHDFVKPRNEALIIRYTETMGRITALVVGTFSIEMIMRGLSNWCPHFQL